MTDIKTKTKERIINDMVRTVKPKSGWKVLIVDFETMRIISAACRMYDIMEEGVTLVEKITISREPLPNLEAIYFLSPTQESVDLLLQDFQNPKEPQYGAVHLFFSASLPAAQFTRIKASNVVSRIKTLVELNLQFIAYESQVFHFDSPQTFKALYSPEAMDNTNEQRRLADKIASVCATLKDYPVVRYALNKDNTGVTVAHELASIVQDKLDALKRASPEYAQAAQASLSSGNRSTLVILDRSHDPLSPLLHEFTYQAMLYDLLDIEADHYKYVTTTNTGDQKEKEVILGEHDPLWGTLRHQHIADTINWILDNFNDFLKENKATKLYSGKKVDSLKDMGEAMKAMPQYQEMLDKYSLHIHVAGQAMDVFKKRNLARIASVEQDMATGEDADGKPLKNLISNMPPLLQDPEVMMSDKIRLLMIYIITQEGIKDGDRKRLMDLAKISAVDQAGISNLRYLGVTLSKGARSVKKDKAKEKKKKKQRDDAPPYELSRYQPPIAAIGQDLIAGTLTAGDFPFVKDEPEADNNNNNNNASSSVVQSLRKGSQPRWASEKNDRKGKAKSQTVTGGRIILFVAGGITHSEMRTVYDLSRKFNREVIIGSSAILTPKEYINNLQDLKRLDTMGMDE